MSKHLEQPEPVEAEQPPEDAFARAIAVGIVLVTLMAAAVGYLQSEASKAAARTGADAQRFSVESFGRLARANEESSTSCSCWPSRSGSARGKRAMTRC